METLIQDLRYGVRQLRKSPGFSLVAILMLGVSIGTNSAVFSFIDALYWKPLPVAHADRLVRIYAKGPSGHYGAGFSYPEFEVLRDHNSSFEALSVEEPIAQLHLVNGGHSEEIRGAFVSGNYFELLGIQTSLGRAFLPAEDKVLARDAVAVISDRLWLEHFNRDPAVLGREIHINGVRFKVVGVAPREFYGGLKGSREEVWMPAMMLGAVGYGCDDRSYNCSLFDAMIGRLREGQTLARAQAEVSTTIVWSAMDWPERPSRRQAVLTSANVESPDYRADHLPQMRILMTVTASLLLIACANLAGLLLARGVTRRREIAVRLSIGAQRFRIVRQLLIESLMLASCGGVAGVAVSLGVSQVLSKFYSTDSEGFHHFYDLSFDWRILVYSVGLAIMTGMLFGLVPALRASRQNLVVELKEGGSTGQRSRGWLRDALVIGQLALSMLLVISSGLLIRSALEVQRGTNFDPEHVVVLRLRPELTKYTQPQIESLVQRVHQRLNTAPGIQSVGFMQGGEGLVWDWSSGREVQVSLSRQPQTLKEDLTVRKQDVSENFFRTLKIPLPQGREFGEQDRSGTLSVAIVNEALARRVWPVGSAVGRTLFINAQPFQVIGIAADVQPQNSLHAPEPHLYLSYSQSNATREGDIRFAVRVTGEPTMALRGIRHLIDSVDPNVPVGEDMSLSEQVRLEYTPVLLAQNVLSFCGVLALLLSAMGLYSTIAFAVRTRTREIGIRMAVGARREDVFRLVIEQGTRLTILGIVIGTIAAMIVTRLLAGLLFDVGTLDPATYASVTVLLCFVALSACCLPARRAAQVDPVQSLRAE